MCNDKSKKITIDSNKLRKDAGKRASTKEENKSGIINRNENLELGISHEIFTKEEKNS